MKYDVIVVGGGHAGCEAATAAANLNTKVLFITIDMTKYGAMSCNPAIGGVAKGQIVREIDALGGFTGIVTDKTTIQYRMLNKSKGPAMWSPRAQCDRTLFSIEWRKVLENTQNLDLWQDVVTELLVEDNKILGVKTKLGVEFYSQTVVLTNGTFLNGLIHVGRTQQAGGRMADPASYGITEQLIKLGFVSGRMKTGTPARIDGRSLNFELFEEQQGDKPAGKFSYLNNSKSNLTQRSCYIVYTNKDVHRRLESGLVDSPLYNGTINGIGPRYCPSIEDKIVTFASKERHQLFIEPEGENTVEYYLNGFSSSLPLKVQLEALKKIEGFENIKIFRPGYAIEYDYFPPTQLNHTLETKIIDGLFFAGQINGTTGYEEAAGQGLIAGINAALKVKQEPAFVLNREQAYIGVLIDDLVTKGVDEPYRMFTSRAEHRILLRQDNADFRLTPLGYKIGLASTERFLEMKNKYEKLEKLEAKLKETRITPEEFEAIAQKTGSSQIKQSMKVLPLILRPEIKTTDFIELNSDLQQHYEQLGNQADEFFECLDISIKYNQYIEREQMNADKIKKFAELPIPENFDFKKLNSLSTEARQKLQNIKPKTVGQASRIPGVSPSDINVLLVYFKR